MSEQTNAKNGRQNAEEREPFKITVSKVADFNPIASAIYITSTELCKLTNSIFQGIFVDCEGSTFVMPENGTNIFQNPPFIEVSFNHGKYPEDALCGIEIVGGLRPSGNEVLTLLRYHDKAIAGGDRYTLTDDAKDVFTPILNKKAFNRGNVNWNQIVADFAESQVQGPGAGISFSNQMNAFAPIPYTKVMYLDPANICKLIYGDKDDDGNAVDYGVTIVGVMNSISNNNRSANYILQVTRVYDKAIDDVYAKFGVNTQSAIIR